jgi:arsenical pump membrane protein
MGVGFIADTASLPLIISNLTNIITVHYFSIGFWEYSLYMFLPNAISIILSLLFLYLFYRRDLIKSYEPELLEDKPAYMAVRDPLLFKLGLLSLFVLGIAFFLLEFFRVKIPISLLLGAVAFLLALSSLKNRIVDIRLILSATPWSIVFFSIGMYAVVYSLKMAGYTKLLTELFKSLMSFGEIYTLLGVGYVSALLFAVMNNLPTVMMVNMSISDLNLPHETIKLLALANVVVANIGPRLTPIGSLATLLWLHVLEYRGIKIGCGYYMKVGFVLTLAVLTGALLALWLFS